MFKDNTLIKSNMLRQDQKECAIELCIAVARQLRQQECYPKDENYDKPLGTVILDLDKLRSWLRDTNKELADRIFSDTMILRGVFGYENWYQDFCKFLR
jgi:hypothetical protein